MSALNDLPVRRNGCLLLLKRWTTRALLAATAAIALGLVSNVMPPSQGGLSLTALLGVSDAAAARRGGGGARAGGARPSGGSVRTILGSARHWARRARRP